ncbi:response regulator [Neorhizobium sp. P12A]|uniref:response regulator n=1 Tax=Rhizobium/Agrobacterium group TaxID=227290 RepID=UPI00104C9FC1|nr:MULTISPECIES: response regulator [Rhizobium/Agrobacterium group]KAA0700746.1 response regulator [Neorhizobium sp. P12A]TCR91845.1 two-component system chemotaxis response regulator CheY [Rhizobium sp. BK376]
MQRFMITDTSDVVRKVGKRILSELDFLVSEASNAQEALARCQMELPEYLIVDAGMEGALELIANIRAMPNGKDAKIYYCVVEADLKKLMAGKRAGATDFLLKPFDRKILTAVFGNRAVAA